MLYPLGIPSDGLTDLFVDQRVVLFGGELNEEVASIHSEERREKSIVGDFLGVHAIAVATGTGVDADILAFSGGETVEDSVHYQLEFDEI